MSVLGNLKLLEIDELRKRRKLFKKECGVYFLFHEDDVVYVGKSTNTWVRLASHHDKQHRIVWDRYVFIPMPELPPLEVDVMERAYIAKYKPKHNRE